MSSGARIPLARAEEIARAWVDRLSPFCDRVEVAGSIRRRKLDVGDVEICALVPQVPSDPRFIGLYELIRRTPKTRGGFPGRLVQLEDRSVLVPGGHLYVDLFMCDVHTWGLNFMIRTGSGDFSHAMAARSMDLGMIFDGARVYRRRRDGDGEKDRPEGEPLPTAEERDVFTLLRVPWIPPEQRGDARDLVAVIRSRGDDPGRALLAEFRKVLHRPAGM